MRKYKYFIRAGLSVLVFLLFLLLSRPDQLPIAVLFVPYAFLGLAAYYLWMGIGQVLFGSQEARMARVRIAAYVWTAIIVISAGLSSLGELTFRDFIVLLIFGLGAYFYATRMLIR